MKKILRCLLHPAGISLIALLLLIAAAIGGKSFAWPLYKEWREARWMAMAEEFYQEEEFGSAMDLLRKTLHQNPNNVDAWQLAEKISRARGSGELPFVLGQLLKLKEDNVELRLEMAELALRHGAVEAALETLRGMEEEGADNPRFHQLAASVALAREQFGSAAYHLQELERLRPDDKATTLALASVRLRNPDANVRQKAAAVVRSLANDPDLRYEALRTLLTWTILEKNAEEGRAVIDAMIAEKADPPFDDRLLVLEATQAFNPEAAGEMLVELQRLAGTDTAKISPLGRLLIQQQKYGEVREWIEALPERTRHTQPVITLLLDAASRMEDLPALERYLRIEWERNDHYRLAVRARTLRALGQTREARETWSRAVIVASSSSRQLRELYQHANEWGWQEEELDLLDRIFRNNPREDWAFQALISHHYQEHNTSELVRLLSRRLEFQADDRIVSNNFALLCLLQNVHRTRSHGLAQENFNHDASDPYFATTYAFSLYRQGRYGEALTVIDALDSEQLREQPRNVYYATILAANGKLQEARDFLTDVRADDLLPEERHLLRETEHLASGT